MTRHIVIGTSGWSNPDLIDNWYPSGLRPGERLPYYAKRIRAVEVNSTFYIAPSISTIARWDELTPNDFSFDVRLHRLHSRYPTGLLSLPKNLRACAETRGGLVVSTPSLEAALLENLLATLQPLEQTGKLSSLLLKLSPSFSAGDHDLRELDTIVRYVAPRRLAVEFTHPGWVEPKRLKRTLGYLSEHGAAFVCVYAASRDQRMVRPIEAVTCETLTYLRALGGINGDVDTRAVAGRPANGFSDMELSQLAEQARALAEIQRKGDVRVVLNNEGAHGAADAATRLQRLLA
jgi:uncharacterized protein YecE (DUF72 family)